MLSRKFGIEIEFTGITRQKAADVAAAYFGGTANWQAGYYDTYIVKDSQNRKWKFMYDGSIRPERKVSRTYRLILSDSESEYKVEMVSPILTYREDIKTVQELVRKLARAWAIVNEKCGIHIHLDGAEHTPKSLRNFINLIASRNSLFYKALQVPEERKQYCEELDAYLVRWMNRVKPKTFKRIEEIWYEGYSQDRDVHYHYSRYHFLNLHSFFHGHRTVELRGFNSTMHAGKVRAYIVFALAMNHQALIQKCAHYRQVQSDNEKFAMRVYLVRIGLSGKEFANCRMHLCEHLNGNAAWRYGSKENCRTHRTTSQASLEISDLGVSDVSSFCKGGEIDDGKDKG